MDELFDIGELQRVMLNLKLCSGTLSLLADTTMQVPLPGLGNILGIVARDHAVSALFSGRPARLPASILMS